MSFQAVFVPLDYLFKLLLSLGSKATPPISPTAARPIFTPHPRWNEPSSLVLSQFCLVLPSLCLFILPGRGGCLHVLIYISYLRAKVQSHIILFSNNAINNRSPLCAEISILKAVTFILTPCLHPLLPPWRWKMDFINVCILRSIDPGDTYVGSCSFVCDLTFLNAQFFN